jgi:hypothetical protein
MTIIYLMLKQAKIKSLVAVVICLQKIADSRLLASEQRG